MKILPKKIDIDKAKASEKKIQIDEGVSLARKIDFLRETALKEEKSLLEWRTNNIESVKREIEDYIIVRDNLRKQTEEAEVYRKQLLIPLDNEWAEINKTKAQQIQEKQNIYLLREQAKEEGKLLNREQEKIRKIATEIGQKNNEIEKAKSEVLSLKELAQKEYELAREAHQSQTDNYERKMSEASARCREYEVALSVIEIREKETNEKEVDIIKREQHLETQQRMLRIAKEALK